MLSAGRAECCKHPRQRRNAQQSAGGNQRGTASSDAGGTRRSESAAGRERGEECGRPYGVRSEAAGKARSDLSVSTPNCALVRRALAVVRQASLLAVLQDAVASAAACAFVACFGKHRRAHPEGFLQCSRGRGPREGFAAD